MDGRNYSPASRPQTLEEGRQHSDPPQLQVNIPSSDGGNSSHSHIRLEAPSRPDMFKRHSMRGESTKSVSEALRLARSREEQETLLGADEQADDDGCYPPRRTDAPRAPNPHKRLPVYATIHKIRRLMIASIGKCNSSYGRSTTR